MTVGEKIKQRREYIGMSQDELAKRMGYKDRSSISKIEKGSDKNLPIEVVQKFAKVLGCSPLTLMGWDNSQSLESTLTEQEIRERDFIALFEQLDEDQQILVQNMMKAFLSKQ